MKENTVTGTGGVKGFTVGIEASGCPGTKIWQNTVSNCIEKGIALWNAKGDPNNVGYLQVTGSTVSNCDTGILVSTNANNPELAKQAVNAKIAWNTVSSCTNGIVVENVTSPMIWEKTYVRNCSRYGVELNNAPGANLTGTEITGCKKSGIRILNSKNVVLKWDTIKSCGVGIEYDKSTATQGEGMKFSSNTKNVVYYNKPKVNGKQY